MQRNKKLLNKKKEKRQTKLRKKITIKLLENFPLLREKSDSRVKFLKRFVVIIERIDFNFRYVLLKSKTLFDTYYFVLVLIFQFRS